jgi:hypothetical protein
MVATSGFFDPRGARRAQGVPPRIQYHDADGSYTHVVSVRDPSTGKYSAKHTPIAFGTKGALDFGATERGWLSFRPFDDSHLVPLHMPVASESPGDTYSRVVRIPVFLEGLGLLQWTLGGVIAQNSLFPLFYLFCRSAEAAEGKIPVAIFLPSRRVPIASRNGELHSAPELEIVGWIVRDQGRYGPRRVPAPVAALEGESGEPALPPLASTMPPAPAAAAPVPANDTEPLVRTNDDVFASSTPGSKEPPRF